VLQAAGADVDDTRSVPEPGTATRILVLDDRLDTDQRAAVLAFVEAGGVAIVADPDSTLHGGAGFDGGAVSVVGDISGEARRSVGQETNVAPGDCTIDALQRLRGVYVPDGQLFPVGPTEPTCFTDLRGSNSGPPSHSFVIVSSIGRGIVVGLGDNRPFVNEHLRRADNSGLAVALLVPERNVDVTFLVGTGVNPTVEDVGSGEDTLVDLIPSWVWMSIVLSAVAFVLFAISRAIAPGRILTEPVTSPIAGSELVSATGNLMERAGHASRAGQLLLTQLHRDMCRAHEVDLNAPLADLDRHVARRADIEVGEVDQLLGRTVRTDQELADVTRQIDRLRRRITDDDRPSSHDPTEFGSTANAAERVST